MRENYEKKAGPDTLLLEAKIKREKKDFDSAIELLKTAEQILENPIRQLPAFTGTALRTRISTERESLKEQN